MKLLPLENKTIFHIADKQRTDVMKIVQIGSRITVTVRDRTVNLDSEYVELLKKAISSINC